MLRGAALTETTPGLAAPSAMAIGAACRSQSSHCPALRLAAGGCTLYGPWCRVQPGLLRTCAAVAAPSMAAGRSRPHARRCLRRRGRPSACPHLAVTVHVQGAARARAARHTLGQGHARAHRGHILRGATSAPPPGLRPRASSWGRTAGVRPHAPGWAALSYGAAVSRLGGRAAVAGPPRPVPLGAAPASPRPRPPGQGSRRQGCRGRAPA